VTNREYWDDLRKRFWNLQELLDETGRSMKQETEVVVADVIPITKNKKREEKSIW